MTLDSDPYDPPFEEALLMAADPLEEMDELIGLLVHVGRGRGGGVLLGPPGHGIEVKVDVPLRRELEELEGSGTLNIGPLGVEGK